MTTKTANAFAIFAAFAPSAQIQAFGNGFKGEEKDFFSEKVEEIATTIETMPKTYETDGQGMEAVAHLHYFTPGMDFYITEKDMGSRQLQAFGMVNGELGYISIEEITAIGAELDIYWEPKTLATI